MELFLKLLPPTSANGYVFAVTLIFFLVKRIPC